MLRCLVLVLCCLTGCATNEPTQAETRVREIQNSSPELYRLELELILNLWLHTKREENRLQTYVERKDISPRERDAAHVLLSVVQRQAQETWMTLFKD